MSTKHYDKDGNFVKEEPGTKYPKKDIGPRDKDGKPLRGATHAKKPQKPDATPAKADKAAKEKV